MICNGLRHGADHDCVSASAAVQKLEATVRRMPDSDVRNVWKEQLSEIQAELKRTTESMMTCASAGHQQEQAGVLPFSTCFLTQASPALALCALHHKF